MPETINFVRHGDYRIEPGNTWVDPPTPDIEELTTQGELQAHATADRLIGLGLGEDAVILSSDTPRAEQSASIIVERLGATAFYPSRKLFEAGDRPSQITDLDAVISEVLAEHELTVSRGLVVVTHLPLLRVLKDHPNVENGEVVPYQPGTWKQPSVFR